MLCFYVEAHCAEHFFTSFLWTTDGINFKIRKKLLFSSSNRFQLLGFLVLLFFFFFEQETYK